MSSTLLAGPPGICCVKHVKHEGQPAGKKLEIAGIATYVSEPPALPSDEKPKRILLFYSDVFNPFFLNNQLLQDYFAERGYLVLGLDYIFGESLSNHIEKEGFDVMAWVWAQRKRADEVAPIWLKEVKKIYGQDAKYFAAGYCFGAPFAMDLAATEEVYASSFAHPSYLEEKHVQNATKPVLLLCAEEDFTFTKEARRKAEDILSEKNLKAMYQIQIFGGVGHGFTTKADLSVEQQRWAKEEAADAVIRWFDRF